MKMKTITLPAELWNTIHNAVVDRAMEERALDPDSELTEDLERAEQILNDEFLGKGGAQ